MLSTPLLVAICLAAGWGAEPLGRLPRGTPESVGMDSGHLQRIDRVVEEGLARGNMPGCVVCVGRQGRIVFLKAYGHRQTQPSQLPMTTDTVFDLASVTKPVATATSVMLLVERGQIRLHDPVAKYIPEFAENGKDGISVFDLLLHQGGLIPDNALRDYEDGPEAAMQRILALGTSVEPGTRFVYTDMGFIVLGELVRRVAGKDLNAFTQENLFRPLGMKDTGYLPREELRRRAAPTEQREGRWMQGEVHDPRAYKLGGVAGHAGLFSTAEDLAVYAQMMLNGGSYGGARVLSPRTVAAMTSAYPVSSGFRGLGWDTKTGYSSNRSELFTDSAFGHGGFTGTALWIDPGLDLFVIFLSNRVHPHGKGLVNPLAGRIGTLAAASVTDLPRLASIPQDALHPPAKAVARVHPVLTGIDVLQGEKFKRLQDRRVGLITNQTGINREGVSTVRLLHEAEGVHLVALFSPEHGFEGKLDQPRIANSREPATGLPIFSLYGETRRPRAEDLQGIDTLVFDIQDIGSRFYTYISTMGYAMQAAAERRLRFVVLDRPNPINGIDVSGPVLDEGRQSFVAFHRIPVRHGMTVGELARMFKEELKLQLDLEVIPLQGWRRSDFFDATGLLWVNPSPNMRSLTQALLYPGIGLLEATNLSVGRGTDTPFEVIGAPWLDGPRLAAALNRQGLAGVCFVPIRFTPQSSKFAGRACGGVNIIVTERSRFCPLRTGLEIARQLYLLHPKDWDANSYDRLLGSRKTLQAIVEKKPLAEIEGQYRADLRAFRERRAPFLMYQ